MERIYAAFVDRDPELDYLHRNQHSGASRFILLHGPTGMGKTMLLDEFHAECAQGGGACVYLDLADESYRRGYFTVINRIRAQLGETGWERLKQANQAYVAALAGRGAAMPAPGLQPALVFEQPAPADQSGRSGGITVGGDLSVYGAQIAGRDMIQIYQVILNGAPEDQPILCQNMTAAFQQCLAEICQQRPITLLLDHWEVIASRDLASWIRENLILWVQNQRPGLLVVLLSCSERPPWYQQRRDDHDLKLGFLPIEAVKQYWVEVKGLPADQIDEKFTFPQAMVANARALELLRP